MSWAGYSTGPSRPPGRTKTEWDYFRDGLFRGPRRMSRKPSYGDRLGFVDGLFRGPRPVTGVRAPRQPYTLVLPLYQKGERVDVEFEISGESIRPRTWALASIAFLSLVLAGLTVVAVRSGTTITLALAIGVLAGVAIGIPARFVLARIVLTWVATKETTSQEPPSPAQPTRGPVAASAPPPPNRPTPKARPRRKDPKADRNGDDDDGPSTGPDDPFWPPA